MRLVCAYKPCGKEFSPNTHNQKYCSSECCKLATNAKIMERYYANQARKKGAKRSCVTCGANLSRYNPTAICSGCQRAEEERGNRAILTALLAMNG